jgi:hypothetical protein
MNLNVAVVAILAAIIGFALGFATSHFIKARRKSEGLKAQFGKEYDRMLLETGNRVRTENALEERRERVLGLRLRQLTEQERASFETGWNRVQAHFVDDPSAALTEADGLIREIMRTIGYPSRDLEQRISDISVNHPQLVEHYREAHAIAMRNIEQTATTEDLRHAMLHYRALFEELLGEPAWASAERKRI